MNVSRKLQFQKCTFGLVYCMCSRCIAPSGAWSYASVLSRIVRQGPGGSTTLDTSLTLIPTLVDRQKALETYQTSPPIWQIVQSTAQMKLISSHPFADRYINNQNKERWNGKSSLVRLFLTMSIYCVSSSNILYFSRTRERVHKDDLACKCHGANIGYEHH